MSEPPGITREPAEKVCFFPAGRATVRVLKTTDSIHNAGRVGEHVFERTVFPDGFSSIRNRGAAEGAGDRALVGGVRLFFSHDVYLIRRASARIKQKKGLQQFSIELATGHTTLTIYHDVR